CVSVEAARDRQQGIASGTARAEDTSSCHTNATLEHGRSLMQATEVFTHWQWLLEPFADALTHPGFHRFRGRPTGPVLNAQEHTTTQSRIGLDRAKDWKALESFAEYGHWDQDAVERVTARLLDGAPDRLWYGYRVWAADDSKVHRSSK